MKRIIVCCDGTWYAADKGVECLPSNVARIARAIAPSGGKNRDIPQVVLYQSGVGTGSLSFLDKNWQGAFGGSLDENLCEVYNFIANNYEPGDELFFFGFSRGAYTARAAAGLICDAGLLLPLYMDSYANMFKIYKERNHGQPLMDKWNAWLKDAKLNGVVDQEVNVRGIGVWDTVGALGLPESTFTKTVTNKIRSPPLIFHNTKLSKRIAYAFHALALDEHRASFSPTLWYLPVSKTKKDGTSDYPTVLEQTWFPGYHSDVGGGTTDNDTGDVGDVDEIAFAWMIDRLQYHKILDFKIGDNFEFSGEDMFRKIISPSGKASMEWGTGELKDQYSIGYRFAGGSQVRTPKETMLQDVDGNLINSSDEAVVITNETVHPCVWHRIQKEKDFTGTGGWFGGKKGYYPEALKGWNHEETTDGFVWKKKVQGQNDLVMKEYRIPDFGKQSPLEARTDFGSVELMLMPQALKQKFLSKKSMVERTPPTPLPQ